MLTQQVPLRGVGTKSKSTLQHIILERVIFYTSLLTSTTTRY